MPRKYQRKPGSRNYKDYDEQTVLQAIRECQDESVKKVSERHGIPFRTLWNKVKGHHTKSCGGQIALSKDVEEVLVGCLLSCAEFGMPLEKRDVKLVVSRYLKRTGINVTSFSDNVPGDDWVWSFLKRHEVLSDRMCQNIKRSRAEVAPEVIEKYFTNLKNSLDGVPPGNIVNYDETNLSDDPGVKKFIFRRGIKYPERIINYSKGNISVMFGGTAEGDLLPPFVVYKSQHLWESWCEGGPNGTRYSRSKSGWMDGTNFEEWFLSIIVPWARRKDGPKLMIGDNLSSHLSEAVISKCEELNIRFVLLPPNSTDKCQPLDVSFFGPMKRAWRKVMEDHKTKRPSSTSIDKSLFPGLLSNLIDRMGLKIPENIVAGFKACGIFPYNMEVVLRKFPHASRTVEAQRTAQVSPALLEYLQQFKYSPGTNRTVRTARKRLMVEPGKSISANELTASSSSSSSPQPASPVSTSIPSHASTSATAPAHASTSAVTPPHASTSAVTPAHASTSAVTPAHASTSAATRAHASTSAATPAHTSMSATSASSESDDDSDSLDCASSEDEWQPPTKRTRNIFHDFH